MSEDNTTRDWIQLPKMRLRRLEDAIAPFAGDADFEQIADALGVPRPTKQRITRKGCPATPWHPYYLSV